MPETNNQIMSLADFPYYIGVICWEMGIIGGPIGAEVYLGKTTCDLKFDPRDGLRAKEGMFLLTYMASTLEGIKLLRKTNLRDLTNCEKAITLGSSGFLLGASNAVLGWALGQVSGGITCRLQSAIALANSTSACDADTDSSDCFNYKQLLAIGSSATLLSLVLLSRKCTPNPFVAVSQYVSSFYGKCCRKKDKPKAQNLISVVEDQQEGYKELALG